MIRNKQTEAERTAEADNVIQHVCRAAALWSVILHRALRLHSSTLMQLTIQGFEIESFIDPRFYLIFESQSLSGPCQ